MEEEVLPPQNWMRDSAIPETTSQLVSENNAIDAIHWYTKNLPWQSPWTGPNTQPALEVVANPLAKFFHRCLEISYCPKHFRESITSAIREERKPDYHSVGAYRSIALLNTIGKLLERIVVDRLADMLEIQRMLLEFQIGARRKRSAVSALQLLTDQIQTIWGLGKRKVVALLCLDM